MTTTTSISTDRLAAIGQQIRPTRIAASLRDGRVAFSALQAGDVLVPRLVDSEGRVATIALVGHTATLLAGDRVGLEIEVGEGVQLDIIEPSGTVAYDARGADAVWSAHVRVGAGALLRWQAAPFVVADGADVIREFDADIAVGGTMLLSEWLVLGRTGETGGSVLVRQRVCHAGRPLLVEDLNLREPVDRGRPGILGAARIHGTVLLAGRHPAELPETGATRLHGPGALARFTAAAAHEIEPAMHGAWQMWR